MKRREEKRGEKGEKRGEKERERIEDASHCAIWYGF